METKATTQDKAFEVYMRGKVSDAVRIRERALAEPVGDLTTPHRALVYADALKGEATRALLAGAAAYLARAGEAFPNETDVEQEVRSGFVRLLRGLGY